MLYCDVHVAREPEKRAFRSTLVKLKVSRWLFTFQCSRRRFLPRILRSLELRKTTVHVHAKVQQRFSVHSKVQLLYSKIKFIVFCRSRRYCSPSVFLRCCLHDTGSSSIRNEKQHLLPCLHESVSEQTHTERGQTK